MNRPLETRSIEKCLFGIVPTLGDLFEAYVYCVPIHLGGIRGSNTPHPPDYFFMASETDPVRTWGYNLREPGGNMRQCLYVKPREHVRRAVEAHCTPRIIGSGRIGNEDSLGSFRLIAWPAYGHALVCADDVNHIAAPWVAFVPLEGLPKIDLTNTETYQS